MREHLINKRPFPQHFIFTLVMLDKAHHSDDCKIDHISTLIGKQCDPGKCQCQCHQPLCYRFSFFHLEYLNKHYQNHQYHNIVCNRQICRPHTDVYAIIPILCKIHCFCQPVKNQIGQWKIALFRWSVQCIEIWIMPCRVTQYIDIVCKVITRFSEKDIPLCTFIIMKQPVQKQPYQNRHQYIKNIFQF